METFYKSWRDIPPDTDSAVFSLLWGDIAKIIEAAGIATAMDDGSLDYAPGWTFGEDGEATAEGWEYAAAVLLASFASHRRGLMGPMDRTEYMAAREWREGNMAWFVRVSELCTPEMVGIGRFRLTATSDEDGGGPHGDDSHDHGSRAEAGDCERCQDYCDRVTGIRTARRSPTVEDAAQARRASFRAAALPLMTWLADNAHPHTVAHVDFALAELLEGALVVSRED